MLQLIRAILLASYFLALTVCTEARQLAGKLLFSSGSVEITGPGGKRDLVPGTAFYVGDTFSTTAGGMKLRLREANNEVVLDRDTRLKLLRASTDESSNGSLFHLYKGTVRMVLGASAIAADSRLQIETPVDLATSRGRGAFVASVNPAKKDATFATLQGSLEVGAIGENPSINIPTGYAARGWQQWHVGSISKIFNDPDARRLVDRLGESDQFNLAWLRRSIESDPSNSAYFGNAEAGSSRAHVASPSNSVKSDKTGTPAEASPAVKDGDDKELERFLVEKLGI